MGYGSGVAAISMLINRSYAQTTHMLLPRTIVYVMIALTHTCGASFCLTMSWAVERKNDLAAGSPPSMSFGIPSQVFLKIFQKKASFPKGTLDRSKCILTI